MGSILDDPKVREAVFPLSVEFYHQAGELGLITEDVELLDGNLVKKMSKSSLHSWLVHFLFRLLDRHLPPELFLRKEEPLTLDRSEPEPDLSVVLRVADDYRSRHPLTAELVIEVAVSTVEVDRQKAGIYAAAGVKEYWIVIPESKTVEVHRDPADGAYRAKSIATPPERLESMAITGFGIAVGDLFPG
jgi:Uma2 family endonuclease